VNVRVDEVDGVDEVTIDPANQPRVNAASGMTHAAGLQAGWAGSGSERRRSA
jgi:hypothetical protein